MYGIGHGVLAWASYEIPESLDICDALPTNQDHQSCYSGVFMENAFAIDSEAAGYQSKYIKKMIPTILAAK